jgi:hypothetical protein
MNVQGINADRGGSQASPWLGWRSALREVLNETSAASTSCHPCGENSSS